MGAWTRQEIYAALLEVPALDAHTHLVGGRLGARGLHDVLLYHMATSELYAAGCPSGERLTQYPGWPSAQEARARLEEALPYLPLVRNTAISYGIRLILHDLYGVAGPVTPGNWQTVDAAIRERADDRAWQREILRRANLGRCCTEWVRRQDGADDEVLQYSLEWAFFTRCQWGEWDTALYELERAWGEEPRPSTPIGPGRRPPAERRIRSVDDVHQAVAWYVGHIPAGQVLSTATHLSTDIDYRAVTPEELEGALARRACAGPAERDTYASYVHEAFLAELEGRLAGKVVFQFSLGAEPLPHETGSRLSQRTLVQVGEMVSRHPRLRFQCFLASRHAGQALCSLCRELPNLSLAGYWWHTFYPGSIRQAIEERLDMLPLNRQVGFFSDAYCLEWVYGKSLLVRRALAEVLADKVDQGQYDRDLALDIARQVLYETPQSLLGMEPAAALAPARAGGRG
ncbi:MAG: hypothetical protein AB1505_10205 [Candidatus Latescibacterota bacterium]